MRPAWLRRRGRVAAVAAVLAAVLAACGGSAQHDSAASRPHPPAALGGVVMSDPVPASIARLPLTTAAGQRTTLAAYRGKIVMIADSLTLCQDMCPMISANIAAMARQLQAAGLARQIALLEITVDPQRDTPARLAAYQKMFGSPQPAWTLATATTAAATAALWKFFHVYYQRQPVDDPDATDWLTGQKLTYDVEHSNTLIFLSADGKQRYIVDAAADTGGNRPPPALIRFMTPQGRHNLYHPSPGGSWTVPQAMQVLSWLAGRTIATRSP
jgi:protein SCO1